jgi:hypothetical protein
MVQNKPPGKSRFRAFGTKPPRFGTNLPATPGLSGKKRRPRAKKPQAFINPSRLGAKKRSKTTAVLDGPAPDARNNAKVGL